MYPADVLYQHFKSTYECTCDSLPHKEVISFTGVNSVPVGYAHGLSAAYMRAAVVQIRIYRSSYSTLTEIVDKLVVELDGQEVEGMSITVTNIAYQGLVSTETGTFRYGIITLSINY
jgi:hypothetical protein